MIPFSSNVLYFNSDRRLFHFITETSTQRVAAVREVKIRIVTDKHRRWAALQLLPNLTGLQVLLDDSFHIGLLNDPKGSLCRTITRLRALTKFELLLYRKDRQLYHDQREKVREVEALWREIVTRPKPSFGVP